MDLRTQCHCGNLTLTLRTERAPEELALRTCGCSFCSAHGSVYTSDPAGELVVEAAEPGEVNRYRNPRSFSAHTMFFLVCRICGFAPVAVSTIEGVDYAVINVAGGAAPALETSRASCADHGAESLEARLERRRRTWIPRVQLPPLEDASERARPS